MENEPERFISYGGGVQSSALIVLAAQGKIAPVKAAVFCNTGDDSEHPDTLVYVRTVMRDYCEKNGMPLIEIQKTLRGEPQTLLERMTKHERESLSEPIPVYGYTGMPTSRVCTVDHKVRVYEKWVRKNADRLPVETLIGISVDEIERAKTSESKYDTRKYPLLDLGMTRTDCAAVIRDAGLPVPPKSSCFFCPFHSMLTWSELRRDSPDLFEKSAQLEDLLNERRAKRGMPPVYLTRKLIPVREAVAVAQDSLFGSEMQGQCDSGYCFT